jgi:hypothetical protein
MMLTLLHGSFEWVIAGAIVVLGLIVFGIKLVRGHLFSVIIGACVWFFVFSLHRGSTTGIMTATFAALLFDLFGLTIIRLFMRRNSDEG